MRYHRRSIRLDTYDYTQGGAYFVTLVTAGRAACFGTITNGEMVLNPVGQMILREWQRLPSRFAGWEIDAFVIMPNHIHGILFHVPGNAASAGGGSNTERADGSTDAGDRSTTVGAQQGEPEQLSSLNALRPNMGKDGSTDAEDGSTTERAQRGDSRSTLSLTSLRPYEEGNGSTDANHRSTTERAQRGDSRSMLSLSSLRPYEEAETGEEAGPQVAPESLGAVVRAFKSATTLRYHGMRGANPGPLWQRNYYEHIVRGPADLERIRAYILTNPTQWELDHENPDRISQ